MLLSLVPRFRLLIEFQMEIFEHDMSMLVVVKNDASLASAAAAALDHPE